MSIKKSTKNETHDNGVRFFMQKVNGCCLYTMKVEPWATKLLW